MSLLSRLPGRSASVVIVECRHCGTTVADDESDCPSCGSRELARYDLSAE